MNCSHLRQAAFSVPQIWPSDSYVLFHEPRISVIKELQNLKIILHCFHLIPLSAIFFFSLCDTCHIFLFFSASHIISAVCSSYTNISSLVTFSHCAELALQKEKPFLNKPLLLSIAEQQQSKRPHLNQKIGGWQANLQVTASATFN